MTNVINNNNRFLFLKNLLLTAMIEIAITGTSHTLLASEQEENDEEIYYQSQWDDFCNPILISGLIGVVTGKLSSYAITASGVSLAPFIILKTITEKQQICISIVISIIILIAENRLRKKLTDDLIQKLRKNRIEHTESSIKNIARIASWIGFLIL